MLHNGDILVANSTTHWVLELQAGNRQAANELWERYYLKLVRYARTKLARHRTGAAADENDIALSAFASFYRAAEEGRFPRLADRNDLWRLLIIITQRKVYRQLKHDNCQKRRVPLHQADAEVRVNLSEIASSEPTPEFYLATVESFRDLIRRLGDPTLCSVALMKMEGYTNDEIARRLGCSPSTIERKLRRIRHEWADSIDDTGESGP